MRYDPAADQLANKLVRISPDRVIAHEWVHYVDAAWVSAEGTVAGLQRRTYEWYQLYAADDMSWAVVPEDELCNFY